MVSKEDFYKVWKDTSREDILNQFYYEHYELIKYQETVDKVNKVIDNMMEINYELQDIVICALRYAIGRKTYATEEVTSYIMKYPELINARVKMIMLRDLKDINKYYKDTDIDYQIFKVFEQWLEKLEVE